jgi:hypothetical protein
VGIDSPEIPSITQTCQFLAECSGSLVLGTTVHTHTGYYTGEGELTHRNHGDLRGELAGNKSELQIDRGTQGCREGGFTG